MNLKMFKKLILPITIVLGYFKDSNAFRRDKGNHFEIGPRINGVQSRRTSPGNCHPWAHYLNLCWNGCERFQHYDNAGKSCADLYPESTGTKACRCWFWTPLGDPNDKSDASHWVCGRTIKQGSHPQGLDWIIEDCKTGLLGY